MSLLVKRIRPCSDSPRSSLALPDFGVQLILASLSEISFTTSSSLARQGSLNLPFFKKRGTRQALPFEVSCRLESLNSDHIFPSISDKSSLHTPLPCFLHVRDEFPTPPPRRHTPYFQQSRPVALHCDPGMRPEATFEPPVRKLTNHAHSVVCPISPQCLISTRINNKVAPLPPPSCSSYLFQRKFAHETWGCSYGRKTRTGGARP
jgi:hypothetical protein